MAPSPILALAPIKALGSAGKAPKFNLFVAGMKWKVKGSSANPQEDNQVMKTKCKSLKKRKVVRSKKFASNDESADGEVIIIKQLGTSALAAKNAPAEHIESFPDASSGSTISILTDVNELQPDDWLDDNATATTKWPSQWLHPSTCVQCIKEDWPCLVRLGRLIPEAEDALQDIVAKKKATTASKAAAKEKKFYGQKPAKLTSYAPTKRLVSHTMQSVARLRVISPTKNDSEDDIKSPGVQYSLVDVATEGPIDDAGDNDMQFPQDNFRVEADTPLIDLHTPLDPLDPVPSIQPAPMDPPAEAPSLPSGEDIEDTACLLTLADAPPAAADPAPIILP
ncbi:hypothetical protein BDR06DRAFT_975187 [Suillus hirtellus]|nr:hypothetical protein BDR06DRAFT_975187 [Suillus hirtellus]